MNGLSDEQRAYLGHGCGLVLSLAGLMTATGLLWGWPASLLVLSALLLAYFGRALWII